MMNWYEGNQIKIIIFLGLIQLHKLFFYISLIHLII